MAHTSLAHPIASMKLEAIQDELGITLEHANALVVVSLDETFYKNKKSIRYAYLSVLQKLIHQAMCFNLALVGLRNEEASKKIKADEQSESPCV